MPSGALESVRGHLRRSPTARVLQDGQRHLGLVVGDFRLPRLRPRHQRSPGGPEQQDWGAEAGRLRLRQRAQLGRSIPAALSRRLSVAAANPTATPRTQSRWRAWADLRARAIRFGSSATSSSSVSPPTLDSCFPEFALGHAVRAPRRRTGVATAFTGVGSLRTGASAGPAAQWGRKPPPCARRDRHGPGSA